MNLSKNECLTEWKEYYAKWGADVSHQNCTASNSCFSAAYLYLLSWPGKPVGVEDDFVKSLFWNLRCDNHLLGFVCILGRDSKPYFFNIACSQSFACTNAVPPEKNCISSRRTCPAFLCWRVGSLGCELWVKDVSKDVELLLRVSFIFFSCTLSLNLRFPTSLEVEIGCHYNLAMLSLSSHRLVHFLYFTR